MTPHSSPLPAWLNMLATQAEAKYLNRRHSLIFIPCPSNLSLGIILHASFFYLFFLFSFSTSISFFLLLQKLHNNYNYEICCLYHTISLDFFYSLTPNVDPSSCPSTFSLPQLVSVPPLPYLIQSNPPHLFIYRDIIRPSSRQRGGLTIPAAHLALSGNTFVLCRDRAKSSRHCCEVVQYSVKATTTL